MKQTVIVTGHLPKITQWTKIFILPGPLDSDIAFLLHMQISFSKSLIFLFTRLNGPVHLLLQDVFKVGKQVASFVTAG